MLYQGMDRARVLGQYFTPEPVVELCYRMLRALDTDTRNPRIIDPACGQGAFLAYALAHGITTPGRLYGIEKDPEVAGIGLNILIADGLLPYSHTPTLPHAFDWVVGNPPFGTHSHPKQSILEKNFTIWRGRANVDFSKYPIEILFLERFWQLAKPGGYVAIIVPDGILANARLSYVREWLTARATVKAVVSLPQHTFYRTGAAAKTSILVFKKESGVPSGDRLDSAYHDPKYTENLEALSSMPNVVRFGELIEYTTYGQVGAREYADSGIRLLTPANLITKDGLVAGIDIHSPERFVVPGSWNDPKRSRLRKGDLLLSNSGVGCIGRAAVFYSDESCNISQHINLIRLRDIEPEYLAVYLQTRFARLQIEREKCGVGPCGINFDRIKSILAPILPQEVRRQIAKGYIELSANPEKAQLIRGLVEQIEEAILSGKQV